MTVARLASESDEYRRRRDELLEAEVALKEQRERVADLRRRLPLDSRVEDYELEEGSRALDEDGPTRSIRLSDLFDKRDRPLVLYQFMYGAAQKKPCPMCTMWIDGFNGVGRHLRRWGNFAIVAQADVEQLRSWARTRGWTNLRLVSSRPSALKADLDSDPQNGHPASFNLGAKEGRVGDPQLHLSTAPAHAPPRPGTKRR